MPIGNISQRDSTRNHPVNKRNQKPRERFPCGCYAGEWEDGAFSLLTAILLEKGKITSVKHKTVCQHEFDRLVGNPVDF